jgi:MFS family permease
VAGVGDVSRRYLEQVPGLVLGGVGMALVFSPVANAILGAVRPEEAGQASGANNAIRELGGVFGIAVLAAVFSAHGGYESGQAFVDGLRPALWVGAAVLAAGAVAALLVPGKPREERAPAVEPVPVPA